MVEVVDVVVEEDGVVEGAGVVDAAGVVEVAELLELGDVLDDVDILEDAGTLDEVLDEDNVLAVAEMLDEAGVLNEAGVLDEAEVPDRIDVVEVAKVVELFAVGLHEHAELYRAVDVPQPPVARVGKPVLAVLIVVVYVAQNASADDIAAGLWVGNMARRQLWRQATVNYLELQKTYRRRTGS